MPGDVRPRRYEPRDGHRDGVYGFCPARLYHGAGRQSLHRQGFLPGGGHLRHHDADHEAQLPRESGAGFAAGAEGSIFHRAHGASRAGHSRHRQGCLHAGAGLCLSREGAIEGIYGRLHGRGGRGRGGGGGNRRGEAAAPHPRRWRDTLEHGRECARDSRSHGNSVGDDAHGHRLRAGRTRKLPRHGGHARHICGEHGNSGVRSAHRRRHAFR